MLKYNSDNIFVGYIKQLLSSFNYPDVDVYSSNSKIIPIEGNYYLKDNYICLYKDKAFTKKINYTYNKPILNLTKKFVNKSFVYDEETHIWLGKYLRFLRDYAGYDLMSMYNFFTNTLEEKITIETETYKFDSSDSNYKIYSIPLYLFERYSIYIESNSPVEMICTIGREDNVEASIRRNTYKKVGLSRFVTPISFDALDSTALYSSDLLPTIYDNRSQLRLLLKVAASNNSSIVILTGKYNGNNDFTLDTDKNYNQKGYAMKYNYSVTNYEYVDEGLLNNKLKSPLELISMNTGVSHPFASRLMEYITNNAITPADEVNDNIKRIQKNLQNRFLDTTNKKHNKLGMASYGDSYGIWIPRMTNTLYDIGVSNNRDGSIKDILGYVDKDIEKQLGQDVDIYGGNDL